MTYKDVTEREKGGKLNAQRKIPLDLDARRFESRT